jgi:hypothetical protein
MGSPLELHIKTATKNGQLEKWRRNPMVLKANPEITFMVLEELVSGGYVF